MPSNITGSDMRQDQSAYEDDSVLSSVEKTLAKFSDNVSTPDQTDDSTDDSDSTSDSQDQDSQDSQDSEDQSSDSSTEEDDSTSDDSDDVSKDDSADTQDQKPAIPDNYYRAAIHAGWKPERIDKLYQSDPEGTLEFLKENHEKVNNLTNQFSLVGRKARELEEKPPAKPEPTVNVEDFRKAYEEDPAAAIAEALNKVQTAPVIQQQPAKQDDQQASLTAIETMNNFFIAADMEGYKDFYGESKSLQWNDVTPGQYANRIAVVNRADEILAGAAFLKTNVTVREAIERAHMQITSPIVEKVIRNKIISQVKKKASGVTLRPAKSKSVVPTGTKGQLTEQEIEEKVKERFAKLGKE